MPTVADRIEQAPACEVINLTNAEREIHAGSGWKIARFEGVKLAGFFDPMAGSIPAYAGGDR